MLTNPKISNWRPFYRQRRPCALDLDQITHDITEAEYVACGHAGRDLTWFAALLRAWYVPSLSPISLRIDDKPAHNATGIILPHTIVLAPALLKLVNRTCKDE
jgi:hypothetical protein